MDITTIFEKVKEESKNFNPAYALNVITVIFLFDDYQLYNGSSLQSILLQNSTGLSFQIPIFFIIAFVISQGVPLLRLSLYIFVYLLLTLIDQFIGFDSSSLISENTKENYLKRQITVLEQAYKENNIVQYNLYLEARHEEKEYQNFQDSLFGFAIVLSINYLYANSILRLGLPEIIQQSNSIIFILIVALIFWRSLYRKDFHVFQP
jgi:hypothetical protein